MAALRPHTLRTRTHDTRPIHDGNARIADTFFVSSCHSVNIVSQGFLADFGDLPRRAAQYARGDDSCGGIFE